MSIYHSYYAEALPYTLNGASLFSLEKNGFDANPFSRQLAKHQSIKADI